MTVIRWEEMSADVKTLDFARGCISMQNQLVKFTCPARFGTVRSEVESSRPDQLNQLLMAVSFGGRSWAAYTFSLLLKERLFSLAKACRPLQTFLSPSHRLVYRIGHRKPPGSV